MLETKQRVVAAQVNSCRAVG